MRRLAWVEIVVVSLPGLFVGVSLGMLLGHEAAMTEPNLFVQLAPLAAAVIGAGVLIWHTERLVKSQRDDLRAEREEDARELALAVSIELGLASTDLECALSILNEGPEAEPSVIYGASIVAAERFVPTLPVIKSNMPKMARFGLGVGRDLLNLLSSCEDLRNALRTAKSFAGNTIRRDNEHVAEGSELIGKTQEICDELKGALDQFQTEPAKVRARLSITVGENPTET